MTDTLHHVLKSHSTRRQVFRVRVPIATISMAASAEAGWKWKHNNHGWKWKHGNHHGIKIYSPGYYGDYCFVKKIKKYDDWGNVYIKKVRVCDY